MFYKVIISLVYFPYFSAHHYFIYLFIYLSIEHIYTGWVGGLVTISINPSIIHIQVSLLTALY